MRDGSLSRSWSGGLFLAFLVALWAPAPGRAVEGGPPAGVEEATLTGTLSRPEGESAGQAACAVRDEPTGELFLVTADAQGQKLAALLGKRVRVTGEISADEEGRFWITVRVYEEAPPPASPAPPAPTPDRKALVGERLKAEGGAGRGAPS